MSDWSSGYVSDVGYTYGYYPDLNPNRIALGLTAQGLASPEIQTACEIGFGQGMSINFHAAGSAVRWFGNDFNPSQAAGARELANVAGSGAVLSDASFAEYANEDSLPGFDFIALHGIWSWVSEENRAHIIRLIRDKLNVGGVLYISYNTLPGWGSFAPVRHLMTQHASVLGAEGSGTISRVDNAINFAQNLFQTEPRYLKENAWATERLERLSGQGRHYLAHEYFNKDWTPMYFSDVAESLQSAKLQFAGSANFLDYVDAVNLLPDQIEFLSTIPDPIYKESVRDFMLNQQFRRDYWVKGARKITQLERVERMREVKVVLTMDRNDVPTSVDGALGSAELNENIYPPLLDELADHQPKSIGELELALADKSIDIGSLVQAVLVLSSNSTVAVAEPGANMERAQERCEKLNLRLFNRARSSGDIGFLVSPVTAGGIKMNRFDQLFTACAKHGQDDPVAWASEVWGILESQGHGLIRDGVLLEDAAENIAELTQRAEIFAEKRLPVIKALKII